MRPSLLALVACWTSLQAADITLTEGTALSVDATTDGRIAFDLVDRLWLLPTGSAKAELIDTGRLAVREPRWSPDGRMILFRTTAQGRGRQVIIDLDSGTIQTVGTPPGDDRDGDWHPSGERLVLASTEGSGYDLFEVDIATGLRWRLTALEGDELDPAWSEDGRDLVYIHRNGERWSLMRRRFGHEDEVLLASDQPLSSPSIRPDKSLVTFIRHDRTLSIDMLILSEPPLQRTLVRDRDIFDTPIVWLDRQHMVYAANGAIRRRDFDSWIPRNIPFQARLRLPPARGQAPVRELPAEADATRRWKLRVKYALAPDGERFDRDVDILIRGERIERLAPSFDGRALPTTDLGDVYAVPGIIDLDLPLPPAPVPGLGPWLLSLGITAVSSDDTPAATLASAWVDAGLPGPRVLPPDWRGTLYDAGVHGRVLAHRAVSAAPMAEPRRSPAGNVYDDQRRTNVDKRLHYVAAGRGDAGELLSRLQAFRPSLPLPAGNSEARQRGTRRVDELPAGASLVIGSAGNGLPVGLGTLAALLDLSRLGIDAPTVLAAATSMPAELLGLGAETGRLQPGAVADIVLLGADPLRDPEAWLRVVGVVRGGRFYSASGLADMAGSSDFFTR